MFTSISTEYETPQGLFDQLNQLYNFELDVCATKENAKCSRFFSKVQDGLSQPWTGVCWMNPPYGREIYWWMKKAYESSLAGATVVCLVPSRTDTQWWHEFAMEGEIYFIKGRLRFGGYTTAPFPSAIIVLGPKVLKSTHYRLDITPNSR